MSKTNLEDSSPSRAPDAPRTQVPTKRKALPGIEASKKTEATAEGNADHSSHRREDPAKKKKLFNTVMNKFNGLFDQWEGKLDELNHQMDTLRYHQNKYGRMR